jgi:hypothetical protein
MLLLKCCVVCDAVFFFAPSRNIAPTPVGNVGIG